MIIARYTSEASGVVGTYVDSYHGWAIRGKYESCGDLCQLPHGAWRCSPKRTRNRPSIRTTSMETCGQLPSEARRPAICRELYPRDLVDRPPTRSTGGFATPTWILIAVVIGGMIVHNLVILNFHAVRRAAAGAGDERSHGPAASIAAQIDPARIDGSACRLSFSRSPVSRCDSRRPGGSSYLSVLGMSEPVRDRMYAPRRRRDPGDGLPVRTRPIT